MGHLHFNNTRELIMSDVKYLDLDALAPKARFKIKLNEKEHVMKEMTVEDFVWATKEAELRTDAAEDAENIEKHIEVMLKVLCRQFPTAESKDFESLGFDRLTKLIEFTRDLAEEGSEGAIKKAADEGKVDLKTEETNPA